MEIFVKVERLSLSHTQLGPRGTGYREEWRPAKKNGHLPKKR